MYAYGSAPNAPVRSWTLPQGRLLNFGRPGPFDLRLKSDSSLRKRRLLRMTRKLIEIRAAQVKTAHRTNQFAVVFGQLCRTIGADALRVQRSGFFSRCLRIFCFAARPHLCAIVFSLLHTGKIIAVAASEAVGNFSSNFHNLALCTGGFGLECRVR